MKKDKLYDYEVMKVIAILLVVFGHVTRMFSSDGAVAISMESEILTVLTNFIYMFHMPAFVAVTGAVYYFVKRGKGRYNNRMEFIINKALLLLIPYLFFAVIIVLPTLLYIGIGDNVFEFILRNVLLFSGPNHLWYSVMIFNVFVIFNLFERKIYSAGFLKNCVFFAVLYVVSMKSPGFFQISGTLRYILFFYLGYTFQKEAESLKPYFKSNKATIITFIATLSIFYLYGRFSDNLILRKLFELSGAVSGALLLYLISYKIANTRLGKSEIIAKLAKDSYGIYLFHPMIIYILFYWIKEDVYNPYLTAVVVFSISITSSVLLIKIFRQFKIQFLIGEKKKHVVIKSGSEVTNIN